MAITAASGCAKGVEAESFTFGPAPGTDTGNNSTTLTTTDPIDPTGIDSMTDTGGGADTTMGGADTDSTDPGTTTDSPDTTTGPGDGESTSDGPPPPMCGDEVIEGTEECDGANLADMTCADVDPAFTGGTLACDGRCAFDTSGCSAAENPIVMCQVAGTAIPDSDPAGITDTITLPPEALGGTITDVDVEVELDHTYIGDLVINVTANFTSVDLFEACTTEENLHATFDDDGGAFSCASSDVNAVVTPLGSLATFNGGAVPADWALFIADEVGADTGTLTRWCVTIGWM